MTQLAMIGIDVVAILLLCFGVYFRRHRRRDLVTAFLGVNASVLAVALVLGSITIGIGIGMGLFGVLSIIRLRSSEIAQHDMAYYFAALSIGLICGLATGWLPIVLVVFILLVLYLVDHPRLLPSYRTEIINVDAAITDRAELTARVEQIVDGTVRQLSVQRLDLVNDTTLVSVSFTENQRTDA
ncbi:MAG TPA: DUF4956 domain-containing protein [Pseudoclavibacter sp.]|nr:DUF4956 domain-containing protein [Pseudoclavibacter sp.]